LPTRPGLSSNLPGGRGGGSGYVPTAVVGTGTVPIIPKYGSWKATVLIVVDGDFQPITTLLLTLERSVRLLFFPDSPPIVTTRFVLLLKIFNVKITGRRKT
jgi:hypothetical protein